MTNSNGHANEPVFDAQVAIEEMVQNLLDAQAAINTVIASVNAQAEALGLAVYTANRVWGKLFADPKSPLHDPKFIAECLDDYRLIREQQIANAARSVN